MAATHPGVCQGVQVNRLPECMVGPSFGTFHQAAVEAAGIIVCHGHVVITVIHSERLHAFDRVFGLAD